MRKNVEIHQTNLKSLLPFVIMLSVILLLASLMKLFHIQINITPSMPIGLYQQLPTMTIHRGDIVAVCLPTHIAKIGLKNGYLLKGNCPSGAIPVLKEVIAIPHDTVQLTSKQIIVNGKRYKAPQQKFDHSGYPIQKWVGNGTYQGINGYWLYGIQSVNYSWDSRYYGEISRSDILKTYKLGIRYDRKDIQRNY